MHCWTRQQWRPNSRKFDFFNGQLAPGYCSQHCSLTLNSHLLITRRFHFILHSSRHLLT